jgi:alpha-amylase/alpha-mannosidase (GH57 family)
MTPERKKLKVAFLWHMHQPYYLNPETNRFMMPWVRLHGLKDYLDMPLLAAKHGVKFTFNLVPSLIDQIELYCQGYVDRHQELSKINARELTPEMKKEIMKTFFSASFPTMINPYPRYRQLYRKQESCGSDIDLAVEIFSTSEWRDLQVWSNLAWIDPMFRKEKPVAAIYQKGRDFTEQDKANLLDYQIELLKRIIPTYKKLFEEGKIDISFTPYYHPILPLLIDTDIATEAIPDVALPKNRFDFPEDADWHIKNSAEKYRSLFGKELNGIWPSEGSVSEAVLKLVNENDIRWIATDEEVLHHSLLKSGLNPDQFSPYAVYTYEGAPDVRVFFRDHGLSDKIGFVYSGWETERAVTDFIQSLKNIRRSLSEKLNNSIVPIILDGENAWEYFPRDGSEFLNRFCEALVSDDEIEVVSFTEAAENIEPVKLSSLFAGSWINHNFRIWIGHIEDNHAWDALYEARKILVEYQEQHPGANPDKIADAWRQIHIAEGSDWCWWFGDDHIGAYNTQFDKLFRAHLEGVYRILGIETPVKLLQPIHRPGKMKSIQMPEALITPQMDGNLTHFYEWSGAGHYDCSNVGGAMHRAEKVIKDIYFAFDFDSFYIRLDFDDKFDLVAENDYRVVFDFKSSDPKEAALKKGGSKEELGFGYAIDRILEARFHRKILAETGNGKIEFNIIVYAEKKLIEKWPPDETLKLELPDRSKMSFWEV